MLWLAPNGLKLLERLGLISKVKELSCTQQSIIFADSQLQTLMQMKGEALQSALGYSIMVIKRGELYQLMLDAVLAAGGVVHFSHELQSIQEAPEEVALRFANGVSRVCDFVIAADGIGSAARRLLIPQSRIHYQGIRTYLGRSVTPAAQRFIGKTIESWGHGTRFVVTSMDGQEAYWSAIVRPKDYVSNSAPLPEDMTDRLKRTFAPYHRDIQEIVAQTVPGSIYRYNFGMVQGLQQYATRRVALIGDAAHGMPPNAGQGASLGLEDALHMVNMIEQAQPDSGGLSGVMDRPRIQRARQMMRVANSMNVTFQPKSRWASFLRDRIASCIPDRLNESRMVGLYKLPPHLCNETDLARSPAL